MNQLLMNQFLMNQFLNVLGSKSGEDVSSPLLNGAGATTTAGTVFCTPSGVVIPGLVALPQTEASSSNTPTSYELPRVSASMSSTHFKHSSTIPNSPTGTVDIVQFVSHGSNELLSNDFDCFLSSFNLHIWLLLLLLLLLIIVLSLPNGLLKATVNRSLQPSTTTGKIIK